MPKDLVTRSPVVTVMGHVDHGKTTLLDSIRDDARRRARSRRHHAAHRRLPGAASARKADKSIVFLDTPGHSAFTMMRARGAKVTDVVVLVVAADDGVMPQTQGGDRSRARRRTCRSSSRSTRSTSRARTRKRSSGSSPTSNLVPEDWGGSDGVRRSVGEEEAGPRSAARNDPAGHRNRRAQGQPEARAIGTVLETKLDRGRGPVATVLVQDGTLRVGDNIIAGPVVGRVRALIDDRGRALKVAGPSTPVEVLGLETLPSPGDSFQSVADPAKARQIATFRQAQAKERALGAKGGRLTLESLQAQLRRRRRQGAADHHQGRRAGLGRGAAPTRSRSCPTSKTKIKIIHSAVGAINESDVLLADGVERDHHRLQRAAGSQRRRRRRAREGRHPPALGHLQRDRRDQEGDDRPARADVQGTAHRQRAASARRSRCRRSARSPAAWSPTAASPAAATPRRACCATTSWCGKASWRRSSASRTTCPRSRPASSAASACRTSTTSRSATSSKCSTMERVAAAV